MSTSVPKLRFASNNTQRAFTLIEVLVSMVILAMILLVITSVIGQAQRTWKGATSKLSQFREARQAFDTVARGLRQAMINSYYDYPLRPTPLTPPTGILRRADLGIRFGVASEMVSGLGGDSDLPGSAVVFQAPLGLVENATSPYVGLKDLLCARGYFVQFSDDTSYMPAGLKTRLQPKSRYRLIEYRPSTERNGIYSGGGNDTSGWTEILGGEAQAQGQLRVVANNIVGMFIATTFNDSAAGGNPQRLGEPAKEAVYDFSSYSGGMFQGRTTLNSMPVSAQLVMVAIDDDSASRMSKGSTAPDIIKASGATFKSASALKSDLDTLKEFMVKQKYNYRIFSSHIFLPANEI